MSMPKLIPTANTHIENQLKPTYDALINSLQAEVQFYQKEYESLRIQIIDLTSTPIGNQQTELRECCCDCTDLQKHKQLTDSTITNLNEQLRLLNNERDTLNTLWRTSEKTITNLEVELAECKRLLRQPDSVMLVKKQFAAVTRAYEANVAKLKAKLADQHQVNAQLTDSKDVLVQQLATIEEKYKSFLMEHTKSLNEVQQSENVLNSAKSRLVDILQNRIDLEKQLNETKVQLQEHVDRESVFLSKIQEVLQLADAAMMERSTAEQRELDTRDECEHLATTIGEVMDEAANACERGIQKWQNQYELRIKQFREQINNLTTKNTTLTNKLYAVECRGMVLEGNLKTVLQINGTLDAELQIASKTIIEMEIKMQAFEKLLDQEKEAKQITDERAQELHAYLVQNNKLKQRWKTTVEETMAKLQSEVSELHAQNVALQREKDLFQERRKEITTTPSNRGNFRTFSANDGS